MKVSLVIPGKNVEFFIDRCLSSALPLLNSGALCEIIFVDNNSSDRTLEIVSSYGIKFLQCAKNGASAARNVGWRHAEGEFVWFVDADCRVESKTLLILLETIQNQNVDAVAGGYLNGSPKSILAELIQVEFDYRYSKMQSLVSYATTCNLLCHKNLLVELNGFSEDISSVEDGDFIFRAYSAGKKILFNSGSRLFHLHPTNLITYLRKQAAHGFWAVRLYSRHPERVYGHSYSNIIDHIQPFLVLLFIASAAFLWSLSLLSLSLFFLAQIPIVIFIYDRDSLAKSFYFVLLSLLRTIARAMGICLGLACILNSVFKKV